MRTLSHDGFGRFTIVSERVNVTQGVTCKFCGQVKRSRNAMMPHLYKYGTVQDDRPGRVDWQEGLFCSIGCSRAYHG